MRTDRNTATIAKFDCEISTHSLSEVDQHLQVIDDFLPHFFEDLEVLYWQISGLYSHSYLASNLHANFADHVEQ